jgi:hypothetical protein
MVLSLYPIKLYKCLPQLAQLHGQLETSTIEVSLASGTINPGDAISEGPQSTGFFDARNVDVS